MIPTVIGRLLPLMAAVSSRLVLLLVIIVTKHTTSTDHTSVVAGIGIISAVGIVADAGASTFLLSIDRSKCTLGVFVASFRLQLYLALFGAFVASVITFAVTSPLSRDAIALLIGIAASQALDSSSKAARAPLLLWHRDGAYARPEIYGTAGKLVVLFLAWLTGSAVAIGLFCLVSMAVAIASYVQTSKMMEHGEDIPQINRTILRYGLSSTISTLYSQTPLLVGSIFLGVADLANLAAAYRVTQPMEIIPATLSVQLLPRANARSTIWHYKGVAVAVISGLALTNLLVFWRIQIAELLGVGPAFVAVLLILSLSLGPKFANYYLGTLLVARSQINERLMVSLLVGVIVSAFCFVDLKYGQPISLVWVTVAGELLLAAGFFGHTYP